MTRGTVWRFASLLMLLCYFSVTENVWAEGGKKPDEISRDGTLDLSWQSDYAGFEQLTVRQASGKPFAVYPVIQGQNWSLSGLSDGDYHIELSDNTRSKTIHVVRVEHYSLHSALTLFAIGLLLFAYLLFTLKRGEGKQ